MQTMRAYHPPTRRPFPTIPHAVERLPINLLRDSLYPGRQQAVADAIIAWQGYMAGQPQPTLLPQRMAFQQWKTTASQQRKSWLSSAGSYMALSDQFYRQSGVPTRVARTIRAAHEPQHPPYRPAYQQAQQYNRMPSFGTADPVLLRALAPKPTTEILAGRSHVAAPFPDADRFIATYEANSARAVARKVRARNDAERGVRLAIATREGMQRGPRG